MTPLLRVAAAWLAVQFWFAVWTYYRVRSAFWLLVARVIQGISEARLGRRWEP